jgi:hypothetical protein
VLLLLLWLSSMADVDFAVVAVVRDGVVVPARSAFACCFRRLRSSLSCFPSDGALRLCLSKGVLCYAMLCYVMFCFVVKRVGEFHFFLPRFSCGGALLQTRSTHRNLHIQTCVHKQLRWVCKASHRIRTASHSVGKALHGTESIIRHSDNSLQCKGKRDTCV